MPAPKPSTVADWDTSLSNLLMPSSGQIASGWAIDQVPPSNWFNWWMNLVGQWSDYLRDFEIQAHTWTVGQTFSGQCVFTGSPEPINCTGQSTFAAVSSGTAVLASSAGVGQAVFASNSSSGDAVTGSSTSGRALRGISVGGGTPLHLDPQTIPSSPAAGDIWIDSSDKSANFETATGQIKLLTPTTPIVVGSGGGAPAYQNSFSGALSENATFWIDPLNVVHLSGIITNTSGMTTATAWTMPSGYYNTHRNVQFQLRDTNGNDATIVIDKSTGHVTVAIAGALYDICLWGLTYELGF